MFTEPVTVYTWVPIHHAQTCQILTHSKGNSMTYLLAASLRQRHHLDPNHRTKPRSYINIWTLMIKAINITY